MTKTLNLTVQQYRENYTRTALEQLLYFADKEKTHEAVQREAKKIRKALDSQDVHDGA